MSEHTIINNYFLIQGDVGPGAVIGPGGRVIADSIAGGDISLGLSERAKEGENRLLVTGPTTAESTLSGEYPLDEISIRESERQTHYVPNRELFVVHKLAPSKIPGQKYDILIYLFPHEDATLEVVERVEYYFGKYWGYQIFTSVDRSSKFAVATAAYGSFVCTAKLYFTDGETATVWRYIDFEMGSLQ